MIWLPTGATKAVRKFGAHVRRAQHLALLTPVAGRYCANLWCVGYSTTNWLSLLGGYLAGKHFAGRTAAVAAQDSTETPVTWTCPSSGGRRSNRKKKAPRERGYGDNYEERVP
jgi:hypothetical protein